MRDDNNFNFRVEPWDLKRIHRAASRSIGHLIYFNKPLLESTFQGLGRSLPPKSKKLKREIGGSWFKFSQETERSDHEKCNDSINELISLLEQHERLSFSRPSVIPQNNSEQPPYIMEEFFAEQYIFFANATLKSLNYDVVNVWIGRPFETDFSAEPYVWSGSYLILVEASVAEHRFSTTISGCSALKFLYNLVQDNPLFKRDGKEILGRWDVKPIEDKMKDIGGQFVGIKRIKSLYRIRYMTNEQYDPRAPNEGRVHDIFAYPVFVSDVY